VRVSALNQATNGFKFYTDKKILIVGCTTDMAWTDQTNTIPDYLLGNPSKTAFYTFLPPTPALSYCPVQRIEVISVSNSVAAISTLGVSLSSTCTSDPCYKLDLYAYDQV